MDLLQPRHRRWRPGASGWVGDETACIPSTPARRFRRRELLGAARHSWRSSADCEPWSERLLFAPGLRLGGGTDEIQRNIIAEQGLGLPREPREREPYVTTRRKLPWISNSKPNVTSNGCSPSIANSSTMVVLTSCLIGLQTTASSPLAIALGPVGTNSSHSSNRAVHLNGAASTSLRTSSLTSTATSPAPVPTSCSSYANRSTTGPLCRRTPPGRYPLATSSPQRNHASTARSGSPGATPGSGVCSMEEDHGGESGSVPWRRKRAPRAWVSSAEVPSRASRARSGCDSGGDRVRR